MTILKEKTKLFWTNRLLKMDEVLKKTIKNSSGPIERGNLDDLKKLLHNL